VQAAKADSKRALRVVFPDTEDDNIGLEVFGVRRWWRLARK